MSNGLIELIFYSSITESFDNINYFVALVIITCNPVVELISLHETWIRIEGRVEFAEGGINSLLVLC